MAFSDSHVHLNSYPQDKLESIFNQMKLKQVELVLNVGVTLKSFDEMTKMARDHEGVLLAVGIHPGRAMPLNTDVKKQLEELSLKPGIVAFGEIGVEYHGPDGSPTSKSKIDIQKEVFLYQLSLAKNMRLPVDIHYSMDAQDYIINIFRRDEYRSISGIAHGFQGTLKDLQAWLDIGFYISIGAESLGIWKTIKKAPPLSDEVIRAIPADRLLSETDSIFNGGMQQEIPLGGSTKMSQTFPKMQLEDRQPADVLKVVEKIGKMRGVSTAEIGNIMTQNLKHLLKIS